MSNMIKEPAIRPKKSKHFDVSKFTNEKRWSQQEEHAIKSVFGKCSEMYKVLSTMKSQLTDYPPNYQQNIYTCANKYEQCLHDLVSIVETTPEVSNITLPEELSSKIKAEAQKSDCEEVKEEQNPKESFIKQFHQDIYYKVLLSTQVARGVNLNLKKLEESTVRKADKLLQKKDEV